MTRPAPKKQGKARLSTDGGRRGRRLADGVIDAIIADGSDVDQKQVETNLRKLACEPDGLQHLEEALETYGDGGIAIIAEAQCHRIAADLTCAADLRFRQVRIFSILGVAMGCATAVMVFCATKATPIWRLTGLTSAVALISGIGLVARIFAARRRRVLLREAGAMKALAAGCRSVPTYLGFGN